MADVHNQILKTVLENLTREELLAHALGGAIAVDVLVSMTPSGDVRLPMEEFSQEERDAVTDSFLKVRTRVQRLQILLN